MEGWLAGYGKAWESQDPDQLHSLFSDDAAYEETPFDRHMRGIDEIREYWATGGEFQREIEFRYEVLATDPAIARWWATYLRTQDGGRSKLDGIFLLEFDDKGRCTSLKEWWHAHPRPSF